MGTRRQRSRLALVLVLTVGLLGLAGSLSIALAINQNQQRYAAESMNGYADDVATAVNAQLDAYSNTLADMAASVGAQSTLTDGDYLRITSGLNAVRMPGSTGISYVVPATTAETAGLQAKWRGLGADDLRLWPLGGSNSHDFVIFTRRFDDGEPNAGADLVGDTVALACLQLARESGAVAVSADRILRQDRGLAPGQLQNSVLLAAPVYQTYGYAAGTFAGWVVMDIRIGDFLAGVMSVHSQGSVRLEMDGSNGPDTVLAQSVAGSPVLTDPALVRHRTFENSQRTWSLTAYPTTAMFSGISRWIGWLAGGGAAVIAVLLTTMTAVLLSSRNRALDQVEKATADLREDIEKRRSIEVQLREREEELRHLAFHDPLTGLANRSLFYDRVTAALLAHAAGGSPFAVFFLDLDGFKPVNDDYGHAAGDLVLRTVAQRLSRTLRAADTAARFGGDEFAVIVAGLGDPADVLRTAERIVGDVQQPIDLGTGVVAVTASVGAARSRPGDSVDDVLREADLAMYTAKTGGKARYVLAGDG